MVGKATVKGGKYTNILMGTVQAAIAHDVLEAVEPGDIPRDRADDLGIIYYVWLEPAVLKRDELAEKTLLDGPREARAKVIRKAWTPRKPSIDWLVEDQDKVTHYFQTCASRASM